MNVILILIILSKIDLAPGLVAAFNSLSYEEKLEFQYDLELELLRYGVRFNTKKLPKEISIKTELIIDDLTKDKFWNSAFLITRATLFTKVIVRRHLVRWQK